MTSKTSNSDYIDPSLSARQTIHIEVFLIKGDSTFIHDILHTPTSNELTKWVEEKIWRCWPADFWNVTIFSTNPWGEKTWCSTSTVIGYSMWCIVTKRIRLGWISRESRTADQHRDRIERRRQQQTSTETAEREEKGMNRKEYRKRKRKWTYRARITNIKQAFHSKYTTIRTESRASGKISLPPLQYNTSRKQHLKIPIQRKFVLDVPQEKLRKPSSNLIHMEVDNVVPEAH